MEIMENNMVGGYMHKLYVHLVVLPRWFGLPIAVSADGGAVNVSVGERW